MGWVRQQSLARPEALSAWRKAIVGRGTWERKSIKRRCQRGETLMLSELPFFPCNIAKVPIIARGFKSARRGANPTGWPLVGFATGAASGIDVLDIDTGVGWYSANFDALPQTRAHQTQRGLHLLFRHAVGLRCSTSRIAPGVDVRADGGYAIFWPREGICKAAGIGVEDWVKWCVQDPVYAGH